MRCAARDDNDGKQCRRKAWREVSIFGDPEISRGWFWVPVCKRHAPGKSYTRSPSSPKDGQP